MPEQDEERGSFHVGDDARRPMGPGHTEAAQPAQPSGSFDPARLDFGHHAGRTIEELAATDPDYLSWLERHPSGVRYRAEIRRVLGVTRHSLDWSR